MTAIVPVLLYHRVSDDAPADPFAVSPRAFADHVRAIGASGRTAITIGHLAQALQGEAELPARAIAVTFDDGFQDTLAATEVLAAAGIPATVYVQTGVLGQGDALRASDLGRLAAQQVELGAHTVSHPRLDELSAREAGHEVRASREAVEELSGCPVHTFAYPHGAHDRRTRQLVIDAGFRSAAAVKNALSHAGDDPFAIARYTVMGGTSGARLEAVLAGRGAPLSWKGERVRTRAFRAVRRTRRAMGGLR